jgi:hypothetical protein
MKRVGWIEAGALDVGRCTEEHIEECACAPLREVQGETEDGAQVRRKAFIRQSEQVLGELVERRREGGGLRGMLGSPSGEVKSSESCFMSGPELQEGGEDLLENREGDVVLISACFGTGMNPTDPNVVERIGKLRGKPVQGYVGLGEVVVIPKVGIGNRETMKGGKGRVEVGGNQVPALLALP